MFKRIGGVVALAKKTVNVVITKFNHTKIFIKNKIVVSKVVIQMQHKDVAATMQKMGFYSDKPELDKNGWAAYFRDSRRTWFTPITWVIFNGRKGTLEIQSHKITDVDWWSEEKDGHHYWDTWRITYFINKAINKMCKKLHINYFSKFSLPIIYHPFRRLWKFLSRMRAELKSEAGVQGLPKNKVHLCIKGNHPSMYARVKTLDELQKVVRVFCIVYQCNPSGIRTHKNYFETGIVIAD